jgi:DNA mismatch repair protein MutH
MPDEDINEMQRIWNDTKEKVKKGIYSKFMGLADSHVGHVRPHGTKDETYPTPEGGEEGKKSFWLNSRYIKQQINKKLNL